MGLILRDTQVGDYVEFEIGEHYIKGYTFLHKVFGKPAWLFYHGHPKDDGWADWFQIKNGKCKGCKKKFPPHEALVLAAKLLIFKDPQVPDNDFPDLSHKCL
jgi:hypothetical protein